MSACRLFSLFVCAVYNCLFWARRLGFVIPRVSLGVSITSPDLVCMVLIKMFCGFVHGINISGMVFFIGLLDVDLALQFIFYDADLAS